MNSHSSAHNNNRQEDLSSITQYKDNIESEKLSNFLKLQMKEIEFLKNEILLLKRKEIRNSRRKKKSN